MLKSYHIEAYTVQYVTRFPAVRFVYYFRLFISKWLTHRVSAAVLFFCLYLLSNTRSKGKCVLFTWNYNKTS